MLRARPGNPARQDLAPLRHEAAEQLHVLVVDVVDLVRAELADLAAAEQAAALALLAVRLLVVTTPAAAARSALSSHRCHVNPLCFRAMNGRSRHGRALASVMLCVVAWPVRAA